MLPAQNMDYVNGGRMEISSVAFMVMHSGGCNQDIQLMQIKLKKLQKLIFNFFLAEIVTLIMHVMCSISLIFKSILLSLIDMEASE